MREYALYQLQQRYKQDNRIHNAGKLGQLYTIDLYTRIMDQRASARRQHNVQYTTSTRKELLMAIQNRANKYGRKIGCIATVPVTVPGSPRYLQKKYEDAIAMSNQLGHADLFVTYTCNVKWREIKVIFSHFLKFCFEENLKKGQSWADRPELIAEVFELKLERLCGQQATQRKRGKPGRIDFFSSLTNNDLRHFWNGKMVRLLYRVPSTRSSSRAHNSLTRGARYNSRTS